MSKGNHMTGIFDTHAHYDDEQFLPDREELLSRILPEKGVCGILNMGTTLETCRDTIAMTKRYPYIYGAVGIHPECAKDLPQGWLKEIEACAAEEKIVAIGEIGLDYHWLDACPKEEQKQVFTAQLELADRLGLPVCIHDREAHGDMMDFMRAYRPKGVMHCFSGSVELSREVIRLGLYIGIGGVVTFKNARHCVEVAADMPLERLLLETDAPYMAPVPLRGKRNDSSLIAHVAERIAEIRGITAEEVRHASLENTRRLFGIPG